MHNSTTIQNILVSCNVSIDATKIRKLHLTILSYKYDNVNDTFDLRASCLPMSTRLHLFPDEVCLKALRARQFVANIDDPSKHLAQKGLLQ